jgi:hypothetical protein
MLNLGRYPTLLQQRSKRPLPPAPQLLPAFLNEQFSERGAPQLTPALSYTRAARAPTA